MSVALLDKTRKINKLIHNSTYDDFNIYSILESFEPLVLSDIYLIDISGEVLGDRKSAAVNRLFELTNLKTGDYIEESLLKRLSLISNTKENVKPEFLGFQETSFDSYFMIVPVEAFGKKAGYLLIYRNQTAFDIDDIVLAENVAILIAVQIANDNSKLELIERENDDDVRRIITSLSNSELKAAIYVLDSLNGASGIVKVSEISEKTAVTRSVIVNAIKKLDTTGVISSKSCGPKGTFIQINNDILYKEIVSFNQIVG